MKALVKVWFKEEGGRKEPVKGSGYRPHIIIQSGNGELLGVALMDDIIYEFGKPHFTEIVSLYKGLVDYSDVQKDAKFTIVEGSLVVGEGRVVAVVHEN